MRILFTTGRKVNRNDVHYFRQIKSNLASAKVYLIKRKRVGFYLSLILTCFFYDCVHFHNPSAIDLKILNVLGKLYRHPKIISFSNSYYSVASEKKSFRNIFEKVYPKMAYMIFTDLSSYQLFIRKYRKASEKGCLIEVGYEEKPECPVRQLNMNPSVIVDTTTFDELSIDHLRMIAESLLYVSKNITVNFICELSDQYKDELTATLENFQLSNRATINAPVKHEELLVDFSNTDLSYKTLNTLACGINVIGSRKDLCVKGYYYIQNLTPKNLALLIKNVLDERVEVDIQGLKRLYSWDARAKQYKVLYETLVKNEVKYI